MKKNIFLSLVLVGLSSFVDGSSLSQTDALTIAATRGRIIPDKAVIDKAVKDNVVSPISVLRYSSASPQVSPAKSEGVENSDHNKITDVEDFLERLIEKNIKKYDAINAANPYDPKLAVLRVDIRRLYQRYDYLSPLGK